MRLLCMFHMFQHLHEKIGGPGWTLEIDESIFRRRKYKRGRSKQQIWIFRGILRKKDDIENENKKRMFLIVVPNRDSDTLKAVIDKYVEKGTVIMSDSWKGYSKIPEMGFENK